MRYSYQYRTFQSAPSAPVYGIVFFQPRCPVSGAPYGMQYTYGASLGSTIQWPPGLLEQDVGNYFQAGYRLMKDTGGVLRESHVFCDYVAVHVSAEPLAGAILYV